MTFPDETAFVLARRVPLIGALFVVGFSSGLDASTARAATGEVVESRVASDDDSSESAHDFGTDPGPIEVDSEAELLRTLRWRPATGLDIHGTLFSGVAGRSLADWSYGAALNVSAARGRHRLGLRAEFVVWHSVESRSRIATPVFNVGVQYGILLRDFIEVSAAIGPSVLLAGNLLDQAGSVGVFVEIRPCGFRWRIAAVELGFDPLTFSIVAPVLGAIPLVRVQFRTVLSLRLWP